jgi:hypothetical protein
MLSDQEVIGIVRRHLESKFPRECSRCGRRYESLAEYLLQTTHVGDPWSADDPAAKAQPIRLIGTISYANCLCGTTLALSSAGLDQVTMRRLLHWAGAGMSRRGLSLGELLSDLRRRIDEDVLREHEARDRAMINSHAER